MLCFNMYQTDWKQYSLMILPTKGKSGKYTDYSSETGITKTEGQSTLHVIAEDNDGGIGSADDKSSKLATWSVQGMSLFIRDFALEREWQKFHTPRNILRKCLLLIVEYPSKSYVHTYHNPCKTLLSVKWENYLSYSNGVVIIQIKIMEIEKRSQDGTMTILITFNKS